MLRAHHDAWVFGVDPALWQLLAYQHFVGGQAPGARLNQKDVAAWVRRSFNPASALYRLFVTQYAGRAEARRAGFSKQKLDYWAFTEDENARIPNFYEPINEFIRRLEGARVVRAAEVVQALADAGFRNLVLTDVRGPLPSVSDDERDYSTEGAGLVIGAVRLDLVCQHSEAASVAAIICSISSRSESIFRRCSSSSMNSARRRSRVMRKRLG